MNKAKTVTFFNDLCLMAPAALIDERIIWNRIDELTVEARFSNHGLTVTATLFFDEKGRPRILSRTTGSTSAERRPIPFLP